MCCGYMGKCCRFRGYVPCAWRFVAATLGRQALSLIIGVLFMFRAVVTCFLEDHKLGPGRGFR